MRARCLALVEQAIAILDEAGQGGSAAACDLEAALLNLGGDEVWNRAETLEGQLWPADHPDP